MPGTSTDLFEIRLSTTQVNPETIGAVYDENIDSPQTLVVAGEVTRRTAASGPDRGPKEFDMAFGFHTPFSYDPADGNLLVDIISLGPTADTNWYLGPDLHDGTNGLGGGVGDPDGYTNPVAPNVFRSQIVPMMLIFLPSLEEDFNGNGTLDSEDIDLLTTAVASPPAAPEYDLNLDGDVDAIDVNIWVKELRQTWIGDANVDGEFDSLDFVDVFISGKYEQNEFAVWSEGDWDADGRFSTPIL